MKHAIRRQKFALDHKILIWLLLSGMIGGYLSSFLYIAIIKVRVGPVTSLGHTGNLLSRLAFFISFSR